MARRLLPLVAIFLITADAYAALIRHGDVLDDTQTGLRWVPVQIPTESFVLDSSTLSIATLAQYEELISHISFPRVSLFNERARDFIEWLGGAATWVYADVVDNGQAGVCHGPNGGGDCYRGVLVYYTTVDWQSGIWHWDWSRTIDTYGPTYPANGHWDSEFVTAWAVQPVPLPGAAGLFACVLTLFSAVQRRRTPSQ